MFHHAWVGRISFDNICDHFINNKNNISVYRIQDNLPLTGSKYFPCLENCLNKQTTVYSHQVNTQGR